MKPVLLGIFALLLSSSCLSGIEAQQNENGIQIAQSGAANKTHITDLNDDILYYIFSVMEFHDIVNTVTAIPEFSPVAADFIRLDYPELSILLHGRHTDTGNPYLKPSFHSPKRVEIYYYQIFLKTMKQFGGCFQRIYIMYNRIHELNKATVAEYVNKYSSKSLKKFHVDYVDGNILNHLTVPFEAVEEFICEIHDLKHLSRSIPWSHLFPKLHKLDLEIKTDSDFSFIDCAFPHLEQLSIGMPRYAWGRIDAILGLIEKNPQLKDITVKSFFPTGFAKSIEPLVPQLESLTVSASDIGTQFICFKNVKHLRMNSDYGLSITNLSLPKLESLSLGCNQKSFNAWTEFFSRHTHLTTLSISYSNLLDGTDNRLINLDEFTIGLPNLTDVTIRTFDQLENETIIQYIESRANLRKFCFLIPYHSFTKNIEVPLRERFQNEWIITAFRQTFAGLCFERMNLM